MKLQLQLLIISLCSSTILFGQKKIPIDTTAPISVIRVINIDSLTKDRIYQKSMLWCAENFRDNRAAINLSNQESGLIVGKGYISGDVDTTKKIDPASFYFNWKIEIKDYKVKFSITDIDYNLYDPQQYRLRESDVLPFDILFMSTKKMAVYWINVKRLAVTEFNAALDRYTVAMNKPDDNW